MNKRKDQFKAIDKATFSSNYFGFLSANCLFLSNTHHECEEPTKSESFETISASFARLKSRGSTASVANGML